MNSHKASIRNKQELDLMRKSGFITAAALKKAILSAKEGISLAELDKVAEDEIENLGGKASFKTVPGYFWATCLTVNDEVVHGIPRDIKLNNGDVLGIDLGAVYKGWHTDASWSVVIGGKDYTDSNKSKFLKVGEEALWKAIKEASEGNRIGDISNALQTVIEDGGYSVVKSLTGHGVGRSPHEEPEIPEFGKKGTGPEIHANMTLAIEAIYTEGQGEVVEKIDGWTIASRDGSLGGLFEMTVITRPGKAEVITDWRKV